MLMTLHDQEYHPTLPGLKILLLKSSVKNVTDERSM
jgi:hypothetical protein